MLKETGNKRRGCGSPQSMGPLLSGPRGRGTGLEPSSVPLSLGRDMAQVIVDVVVVEQLTSISRGKKEH